MTCALIIPNLVRLMTCVSMTILCGPVHSQARRSPNYETVALNGNVSVSVQKGNGVKIFPKLSRSSVIVYTKYRTPEETNGIQPSNCEISVSNLHDGIIRPKVDYSDDGNNPDIEGAEEIRILKLKSGADPRWIDHMEYAKKKEQEYSISPLQSMRDISFPSSWVKGFRYRKLNKHDNFRSHEVAVIFYELRDGNNLNFYKITKDCSGENMEDAMILFDAVKVHVEPIRR